MSVGVIIEGIKKTVKAKTVKEVLEKLNINLETVIVIKDNELVLEDEKLKDKDKIKLIPVVSNG